MVRHKSNRAHSAVALDAAALLAWPLPSPEDAADKDERGRVLIVGGSVELPGAVILAATAAMRAGAGKLCIATAGSIAGNVAQSMPEARVIALDATAKGGLRTNKLRALPTAVDAVLIGPGTADERATVALTHALLRRFPQAAFVLDTFAMSAVSVSSTGQHHEHRTAITPHLGEMAHLTGRDKQQIARQMLSVARAAANEWGCVVALKSETTIIATQNGKSWRHEDGHAGLGVSGSGDVLAGMIAGFAARGGMIEQAVAWGVAVHGLCGRSLARRIGPVGYLARELADEIPSVLNEIQRRAQGDHRVRP